MEKSSSINHEHVLYKPGTFIGTMLGFLFAFVIFSYLWYKCELIANNKYSYETAPYQLTK